MEYYATEPRDSSQMRIMVRFTGARGSDQAARVTLPLTQIGSPGRGHESSRPSRAQIAGRKALIGARPRPLRRQTETRAVVRVVPKALCRKALTQNAERAGSRRRPLTDGYSGSEY